MPPGYRRATSKSSTETSTLLNRLLDRAFSQQILRGNASRSWKHIAAVETLMSYIWQVTTFSSYMVEMARRVAGLPGSANRN